jgi:hypothetical protein
MHKNRIYVPSSRELRNLVLKETHDVPYVGHPGYHKNNYNSKKLVLLARNEEGCC